MGKLRRGWLLLTILLVMAATADAAGDRFVAGGPEETGDAAIGRSNKHQKPPAIPPGPLSLAAAIDIAAGNNPDLLIAASRIEKASAMLEKASAPYYPYVSLYTEYMQGDAPSSYLFKTIDQRKLAPGTDFNNPGWFENFESGVKAGINLYNGGKDQINREMAKIARTLSTLDAQQVENRVTATVISAYYDALAAKKLIQVSRESVESVRSQHRIMNIRFQSGGALKTDILSLEVRMAETKSSLVHIKNRYSLAKAALGEIMGIEPDTPFELADEEPFLIPIPGDVDSAMKVALEKRPELAGIRERIRQSRMKMDLARAGYLPRIELQGRYYVDDPDMKYSTERDNWTAGIFLDWDIFTGFSTKSEKNEAMAQLREAKAADRKALLAVKFDVKKAYLNLDEARARLEVATSSVATAKETYRLIKQQYQGGSVDITRYLETQLAYNRSRIRETTAFFDQEKALSGIARAIGHWTDY